MGTLAPKPPAKALTEQECRDRLTLWREHLIEAKDGRSKCALSLREIRSEIDRLLDEMTVHLAARDL